MMTLGPGLIALAAFDFWEGRLTHPPGPVVPLVVLGRVPLFFYVLQWSVIHMMANIASVLSRQSINWFAWSFDYPPGYGYSLAWSTRRGRSRSRSCISLAAGLPD